MNFEIILADTNEEVCAAFRHLFRHHLVSVEEGDLFEVAADAYVSPGNSHGIMDGGLDRLLRARFPGVEAKVQKAIDRGGGLLPVGQAVIVETDDSDVPFLVCAPTMAVPSSLANTRNVHEAMLAALRAVSGYNLSNHDAIQSVAIPGPSTEEEGCCPSVKLSSSKLTIPMFPSLCVRRR